MDGYGSTHTDTLSQSVTIPAGCSATSPSTCTSIGGDDHLHRVRQAHGEGGSTTLATYSNLNKATGYTQKSFNLTSFAGQTVTVSFSGAEDCRFRRPSSWTTRR